MFGLKRDSELKPTEAFSYSIAGFGQNLICGFVSASYIVYFFTNGLLINPITVGFIMLFTRLFDAFNDPIMGSLVDRTRTKWGKCRPYLLFTPIPIALTTSLIFLPLAPDTAITIIVATSMYVLWSIAYTIIDVPYWGLATQMTADTNIRSNILTVARLFCTAGAGLISLIVPALLSNWLGAMQDADGNIIPGKELEAARILRERFIWVAVVISLLSIVPFFIGFFNTKERFYVNEKPKSLGHNFSLIFKNKPLLLIIASGVLGSARLMFMYSGLYFAQYALGSVNFLGFQGAGLFTILTFSVIPGGLVASVMTPYFARKYGKRNTYIVSHIIGGAVMLAMYFVGYKETWQLALVLVGLVISGIPQGFSNIITYAMIADSVDYLELHFNERGEGICFAMQTFISKIGMAVGAAISAFGLGWAGIVADDISTVTERAKDILWLVTALLPALSMLLSVIPFFFYKFNETEQREAVKTIAERKLALNPLPAE
jgi:sugar (glycoside-pentoside-hexuronide) transporter